MARAYFVVFLTILLQVFLCRPSLAEDKTSLYERLGKLEVIKEVVDEFVLYCATDERIKSFFAPLAGEPLRLAKFKQNLVDQLCSATGGPCTYTGKTMKDAHQGLPITHLHFDALIENLLRTLRKYSAGQEETKELIAILAPMRAEIVTKEPVKAPKKR